MNINEMVRLQGIDPEEFIKAASPSEMGKQIGNAMSVNIIERILHQVFSPPIWQDESPCKKTDGKMARQLSSLNQR